MLIHTKILDAPRDLVWEVWTTPEHIKEWWGPGGFSLTIRSMNVGTGKILDSVMHGWGQDFDNRIEYLEVIKPSLLSYKHFGESEDYNFTVSILFEEVEGKTLLTMKSVFKSKAIIEELNRRVKAIEGAKQTLDRLENYIKILASNKPINNPKKIENMRKIISFMHISLDGFVAGPNGEMNWIKLGEDIFDHVGKRIGETDTALYGRVTYRMMENYWPTAGDKPDASRHDMEHSKWYNKAHKVVLSKTMKDAGLTDITIISDNVSDKINEIKQQAGGEILLFGSPATTHALIQQNLIDGYWLFVNPIILGQGIPLFTDIKDKIKLNLLTTRQFTCGVTELNYTVDRQ